ncbi:MAG: SMI1/KNR4 family protein [Candidatus Angelobacter sp.]
MTPVEELLSVSSEPLRTRPDAMPGIFEPCALGQELFEMLLEKNGFYAFESALHVFPITKDPGSGVEGWNASELWRNQYKELAEGLLFFAEDVFQDQFCLSMKQDGVFRFTAETGQTTILASSIKEWAARIMAEYKFETGFPLAHEWQEKNGPLRHGQRLMPKIPFIMGGEYSIDNLWAGNALEGMRFKGDLALQTMHVPEGGDVKLSFRARSKSSDLA